VKKEKAAAVNGGARGKAGEITFAFGGESRKCTSGFCYIMKKFTAVCLFVFLVYPLPAKKAAGGGGDGPEAGMAPEDFNGELLWDSLSQAGVLLIKGGGGEKQNAGGEEYRKLSFYAGKKGETGPVLLDDETVLRLALPYVENGRLVFPPGFVSVLKGYIKNEGAAAGTSVNRDRQEEEYQFKIAAVIVDPGHGGKDPGAVGEHTINGKKIKLQEKDITLKVSGLLYEQLVKGFPDKKIMITREGDTYPTLEERVNKANSLDLKDNEAIIYVSVHANYNFNRKARGYEVWYLDPEHKRQVLDKKSLNSPAEIFGILNEMMEEEFNRESILIADSISKRFLDVFGERLPSRGLKAEEWFVVRKARMPSVLVELGFVSNEEDAKMFLDDKELQKFSDALYLGIADFIESFENSGGFIARQ